MHSNDQAALQTSDRLNITPELPARNVIGKVFITTIQLITIEEQVFVSELSANRKQSRSGYAIG